MEYIVERIEGWGGGGRVLKEVGREGGRGTRREGVGPRKVKED